MSPARRFASLGWKAAIVCLGTYGLVMKSNLLSPAPSPIFFHYFTNISNLAVVLYFAGAVISMLRGSSRQPLPFLKQMLTLGIVVTLVVVQVLLDGVKLVDGQLDVPLFFEHQLVPIMTVLDWVLFDEKGLIDVRSPLIWPIYPLGYLAVVGTLVGAFGMRIGAGEGGPFPYRFLDVDRLGMGQVAVTVVALVAFFVALGYAWYALDHWLGRRGGKTS